MKTASIYFCSCVFVVSILTACASTPQKGSQDMSAQTVASQPAEKHTPRYAQFTDAVDYLGSALNAELYRLMVSDGFAATVSGGSPGDEQKTAEEETRDRADEVMAELDREIAAQDGDGSQSVASSESYTAGESSNMAGGGTAGGEKMVVAVADFVNDNGKVSKLGRNVASRLTPYLTRSGQFQVLERALIDRVIEEQQFQVSAFVDESSTKEIGKLLGAETIITGTVSELGDAYYFNAKVVDVASGRLLTAIDVEADRSSSLASLYATPLPPRPKEKSKSRIFRAKGVGVPSSKHTNPTLARTMAARAAQADAMRNLVQEIEGAKVNAQTTVKDYMTENDAVTINVNAFLRGARVIDKTEMPDGAVEVEMEVEVPGEFFDTLQQN